MKTSLRLVALLALAGCVSAPLPPPQVSPTPPVVEATLASKVSAAIEGAKLANESNPDGLPKQAVERELKIASAPLPPPTATDLNAAIDRVELMIAGKLDEADKAYAMAQSEIMSLKEQLIKERAAAAIKLQSEINRLEKEKVDAVRAAKDEAEKEQRRLLNFIFHGCGALLVLVGVGCFTFLSSIPFLGPRIGLMLISAGAASIGAGIAVNWVLSHAWVLWIAIGVPLLVAIAFAFVNHHHASTTKET